MENRIRSYFERNMELPAGGNGGAGGADRGTSGVERRERRLPAATTERPPVLDVRGLSVEGKLRDLSFRVHPGEIVGVAWLAGSGRSDEARSSHRRALRLMQEVGNRLRDATLQEAFAGSADVRRVTASVEAETS